MAFGTSLARQLVRIEKDNLQTLRSLRTAGVATALPLIAWVTGVPDAMIPLGVGSLFVGIAESNIHPGHRARIMLWATAWLMALSALGFFLADNAVLVLIASILVAAASGWAGVAGPRSALIGVLSLVLFTITVGLPESVELSASFVALVGLGGLVQTALFVIINYSRRKRVGPPPDNESPSAWFRIWHPGVQRSTYLRHALSMGFAVGVATAISQFVEVPHQYWIPMTVAWIFKSDQNATVVRVIERMIGTLLAIGVAFLWGVYLPTTAEALFIAVAAGSYLLLAFLTSNYSIATFGVTTFVLALFAISGDLYEETVVFRLEATLTAGAIVTAVVLADRLRHRTL